MTITATVNSGAINAVGFPGSQEGASLIELVGTVIITGVISTVTVLSTCGATTTAGVEGVINKANIRAQLTAAVSPTAETFCGAQTKIQAVPDDATATASVSSPAAYLSLRLGGTGTATAASTASALVHTFRGATASCAATIVSAGTLREILLSASTSPGATTSLEALRKQSYSATGQATATSDVNAIRGRTVGASTTASSIGTTTELMKFVHFVGATAETSAFGTASTVRWATAGAATTGLAQTVVNAQQLCFLQLDPLPAAPITSVDALRLIHFDALIDLTPALSVIPRLIIAVDAITPAVADPVDIVAEVENYVFPDLQPAIAECVPIAPQLRIPFAAAGEAIAVCESGLSMRIGVSAWTEGRALLAAVGSDYAINVQAPIERRMNVAYQNRVMEVLT